MYTSQNIIRVIKSRRMRLAGHVPHMGEIRNAYTILVRKPEGKRSLQRQRHGWKDNIAMDLTETGCEGVEWMHVAQDRDLWWALVNMVINLWIP
jgi:hypothetical protein